MNNNKYDVFLLALKESFIGLIPYFMLLSSSLLLYQFLKYLGFELGMLDSSHLLHLINQLNHLTPILLLLSIAYYFAKRYSIDYITNILLSMTILITIQSLIHSYKGQSIFIHDDISFMVILIPITTTYLLLYFFKESHKLTHIDIELNKIFSYILPFFLTYMISILIYILFLKLLNLIIVYMHALFIPFSDNFLFFSRSITEHLLWFIGVNGSNTYDIIFGAEFLSHPIFHNLSYKEFYDLFVLFGGSGVGMALIIAIYAYGKDAHSKNIAKLAAPFAIFNINEILIFGLPIIFNRKLFIPFVLVPILNLTIAYAVLYYYPLTISTHTIPWTTPIFINAYIMTDANPFALGLQLFLLLLDIMIYVPFIRKYTTTQSFNSHYNKLQNDLNISLPLKALEGITPHQAKHTIITSNQEIEKIINMLSNETLMIYYQPKIDMENDVCTHYEALLRLKMHDGKITGPFFLNNLEDGGLAPIIDTWVCQEVKNNIATWRANGFQPKISINLHPDTLRNTTVINEIQHILEGEDIEFELLEKDLYDDEVATSNIYSLSSKGFKIAIDDMGSGYSNLKTLCVLPIDTVKLDKSLIDIVHEPKAYALCKHIVEYCNELKITCVAEGVETVEQLHLVQKLKVKYVQGFYFSPAIELNELKQFKL